MLHRLPKRGNPFTPTQGKDKQARIFIEQILQNLKTSSDQTSFKILQARDLLVEAYSATKSRDKQVQILDLIEIFREYTESGKVQKTIYLLASQINNLENAIRKIEVKVRTLKTASTAAPINTTQLITILTSNLAKSAKSGANSANPAAITSDKPTFASVATSGNHGNWTTVNNNKPTKKTKVSNQLILT
jgi:hypothetical protein